MSPELETQTKLGKKHHVPNSLARDFSQLRANPPHILSCTEAAAYLCVSPRHFANLVRAGTIPVVRLGRRVVVRRSQADAALAKLEASKGAR